MTQEPTKLTAALFYKKREDWIEYVCGRRDVKHAHFRIAYFMARKMNGKEQCMWWGVETIAKELGVSTATVTAATIYMQDEGLMVVTRPARGVNHYWIRMPYDPEGTKHRKRSPRTQKLRK